MVVMADGIEAIGHDTNGAEKEDERDCSANVDVLFGGLLHGMFMCNSRLGMEKIPFLRTINDYRDFDSKEEKNEWATNENLPPNVIKQLAKELKNLDEAPPEGIKVGVNDDNFSIIYADIDGPAGTPYENGIFRMKLTLSNDFPQSPPKGYFLTKIFHPNIATNGEICVNALKKDWNPSLGLRHVLIVIRCLLIEPFPESALNEQAGKMLLENYEEYARHARLYTGIHALKPKPKFKSGVISESTTTRNVDQTNSSVKSADQKNAVPGAASPLAPKLENGQDQPAIITSTSETGVGGSMTAPLTQKKEVGLAKAPAGKKKMDARKKSLKRL
ncbi:ubiquitin-conjugating enzyme E2 22-like [Olea europaea subsp. europaea]|uniref:E2 ubiquitin-conjugating enzyme n=1 Tax=Olea europaea subsp. europaea TaxID=158383 RepID=A0A8S0Q366_OLEEU|nr:ubiquitin-conjugating enzyme E2 22-like [Olea europaea subsp. europaea]